MYTHTYIYVYLYIYIYIYIYIHTYTYTYTVHVYHTILQYMYICVIAEPMSGRVRLRPISKPRRVFDNCLSFVVSFLSFVIFVVFYQQVGVDLTVHEPLSKPRRVSVCRASRSDAKACTVLYVYIHIHVYIYIYIHIHLSLYIYYYTILYIYIYVYTQFIHLL